MGEVINCCDLCISLSVYLLGIAGRNYLCEDVYFPLRLLGLKNAINSVIGSCCGRMLQLSAFTVISQCLARESSALASGYETRILHAMACMGTTGTSVHRHPLYQRRAF